MNIKKTSIFLFVVLIFFGTFSCSIKKQIHVPQNEISLNQNVYKIAVAAPQFGPYEALGLSIVNGAELAVDLKNEQGGINGKKIKLVKVDDGGLSGEGTWRAMTLVEQMVLGVIGHLNSDISIPASEIYSKAMIVQISPGSTSPFFTERGSVKGYVFRTIGRDDEQGKLAAKYILGKSYKKIAVIYNDRSYGQGLASEFLKHISKRSTDVEIVYYDSHKVGSEDFSKEISALKLNTPEILFFVGEYGDAAELVKQMKKENLKTVFLGSEGVFDRQFIDKGRKATEGSLVISTVPIVDKQFAELYTAKFNKEIGSYSANAYDATNILIEAIENAKSNDSEKIAKEVKNIESYKGVLGDISFDSKGDLKGQYFSIYQVKDSMFEVIR